MLKKKKQWILVLAGLAFGATAYYAWRIFSRRVPSVLVADPAFSGTTDQFLQFFSRAADSSDVQFRQAVVELTGRYTLADMQDTSAYFEFKGPDASILQATFNAEGAQDLKKTETWKRDSVLHFRGYYYGFLPGGDMLGIPMPGSVQVGRCRLVNEKK